MAEERRNDRPRGRRPKRKVCSFCVDKVDYIDYKDVAKLRRYVTERAKILPVSYTHLDVYKRQFKR